MSEEPGKVLEVENDGFFNKRKMKSEEWKWKERKSKSVENKTEKIEVILREK
jgi:hypothetical protein